MGEFLDHEPQLFHDCGRDRGRFVIDRTRDGLECFEIGNGRGGGAGKVRGARLSETCLEDRHDLVPVVGKPFETFIFSEGLAGRGREDVTSEFWLHFLNVVDNRVNLPASHRVSGVWYKCTIARNQ